MEVLIYEEELKGKTIVMATYDVCDSRFITVTTDGCILIAEVHDNSLEILNSKSVVELLKSDVFALNVIKNTGLFDLKEYEKEQRLRKEREFKEKLAIQEKEERELYERLKLKFETE